MGHGRLACGVRALGRLHVELLRTREVLVLPHELYETLHDHARGLRPVYQCQLRAKQLREHRIRVQLVERGLGALGVPLFDKPIHGVERIREAEPRHICRVPGVVTEMWYVRTVSDVPRRLRHGRSRGRNGGQQDRSWLNIPA